MHPSNDFLDRIAKFFHLESWLRLLMLCVLVGVGTGLAGIVFDRGLHYLRKLLLEDLLFQIETGSVLELALLILVPTVGLFLAGAIALRWAPEARGGGVDEVIKAFHQNKGQIRSHVPLVKTLCTILTIGSGGSAGKEGPTAQIGAGIGSGIGRRLGLAAHDRRILMLAGCAGGLGAVLRAPLGGALFAAEMLYREPDFEHEAIIPGIISSVTAYSIFTAVLGPEPLLNFKIYSESWPPAFPSAHGHMLGELLHYGLLSLLCGLVAFLQVKGLRLIRDRFFRRLPLPALAKPALGGFLLGGLAAFVLLTMDFKTASVLGQGHVYLKQVVEDALGQGSHEAGALPITARVLLLVLLCKIVATGLTVGCGASGGLLFPTLFIGAAAGAAYAKFWQGIGEAGYLPFWLTPTPEARAGMILTAMGAVFCGCTKTPIASLVLICELSGTYGLVVPLMLGCCSTYLLTLSFSMEEEQVANLAESPAHRGDLSVDVLKELTVADAVGKRPRPDLIPADTPFHQVLERIKHSSATTFPIVDENGCLVGAFSLGDIRQIMNEQAVGSLVVAGDLGVTDIHTVTLDTPLSQVLALFTQRNLHDLPVVERVDHSVRVPRSFGSRVLRPRGLVGSQKVVAMLTRSDLMEAYRRKLLDLKRADDGERGASSVFKDAQVATPEFAEPLPRTSDLPLSAGPANEVRDASRPGTELLDEPMDDSRKPKGETPET